MLHICPGDVSCVGCSFQSRTYYPSTVAPAVPGARAWKLRSCRAVSAELTSSSVLQLRVGIAAMLVFLRQN